MMDRRLRGLAVLLNRFSEERVGEEDFVMSAASVLKNTDSEMVGSIVRIMRQDFGEASKMLGTHMVSSIVSGALASITPFKNSEVEELLRKGMLRIVLSRRSTTLLGEGLSIRQAYLGIVDTCKIRGKSSIGPKAGRLASLLNKASEEEAVLIINILTGRQRLVGDDVILKIVGKAFYNTDGEQVLTTGGANRFGDIYNAISRAVENARGSRAD